MTLRTVDSKSRLFMTIRQRLKNHQSFFLGTTKKEYWRALLAQEFDCKIEDWDNGLVNWDNGLVIRG